jgi:hypothetical protein
MTESADGVELQRRLVAERSGKLLQRQRVVGERPHPSRTAVLHPSVGAPTLFTRSWMAGPRTHSSQKIKLDPSPPPENIPHNPSNSLQSSPHRNSNPKIRWARGASRQQQLSHNNQWLNSQADLSYAPGAANPIRCKLWMIYMAVSWRRCIAAISPVPSLSTGAHSLIRARGPPAWARGGRWMGDRTVRGLLLGSGLVGLSYQTKLERGCLNIQNFRRCSAGGHTGLVL